MKVLKIFWQNLLLPALSLYLIYVLGYWWVWSSGVLLGIALGAGIGFAISNETKS
jgi:hypothetical protein